MTRRLALALLFILTHCAIGCSDSLPPPPSDIRIEPSFAGINRPTEVTISASHLTPLAKIDFSSETETKVELGIIITVGGFDVIDPRLVDRDRVVATVPPFQSPVMLDVMITDRFGRTAVAPAAFAIRDLLCSDFNNTTGTDCDACEANDGCRCDELAHCAAVCGDGLPRDPEECDDGNLLNGDGCSSTCTKEQGYSCSGSPSTCSPICADGFVAGEEPCDDGNTDAMDGCDPTCSIETGWTCTSTAGDMSSCAPVCGDGLVLALEGCDDGDVDSGDGCDARCHVEVGYTCDGSPSLCTGICGDGAINSEQCDDGNVSIGDGCDDHCVQELGYICVGNPSICAPLCGDGLVRGDEGCDDSGTLDGDGCSTACLVEPNWMCTGEPSVCSGVCGDGIVVGSEPCDDGGTSDGDGCSSLCSVEEGFYCPVAGRPCIAICGDGRRRGVEDCDDGGTAAGDGCSGLCTLEQGWFCPIEGVPCVPICGDGILLGVEACDDGDVLPDDGCSDTCTIEQGYFCTTPGLACTPICGDGLLRGFEGCDDGDSQPGDGCSGTCTIEQGFLCPTPGLACTPICGDSLIRGSEGCDDGNQGNGDGCSAACTVETGFTCPTPGVACVPLCGDGLLRGLEACDDHNTANGDGCTSTCTIEQGFICASPGQACTPICGDSLLRGSEGCDDGNTLSTDGCSTACAIEPGYSCPTPGSPCATICGDGLRVGLEGCDDDNVAPGDGCSTTCTVETGFTCPTPGRACVAICGDSLIRGAEDCDDGNTSPDDGCSMLCRVEPTYSCTGLPSSCTQGGCTAAERVNISELGAQGNDIVAEVATDVDDDGRLAVFASRATNLVPSDTNGAWDVFVRDLGSFTTEIVSRSSAGALGNGDSGGTGIDPLGSGLEEVSINANGRYVAFVSRATNLVANDTNAVADVFVRDRLNGTTVRVSVSTNGVEQIGDAMGRGATNAIISADGRYVAFTSWAANLVAGDNNNASDVFVRDTVLNTTERASVSSIAGQEPSGPTTASSIGADGRFVVFYGDVGNIVLGVLGGVFVLDRMSGTVEAISRASGANGTPANSGCCAEISGDGRFVVFTSQSGVLVPNDTNNRDDVFVRDRLNATTVRVSVDAAGNEGTTTNVSGPISRNGRISDDGRFIAFQTLNNFDAVHDANALYDVYLKDTFTQSVSLLSRASGGSGNAGNSDSVRPRISGNAWFVIFESGASDLLAPDANATDLYRYANCPP